MSNASRGRYGHSGIQQAYEAVRAQRPAHLRITRSDTIAMPAGSSGNASWHQQGIQRTVRGEFVVSGSAPAAGYLYFTNSAGSVVKVLTPTNTTEPPHVQDLNHLGGLQVAGDFLAVGYERYENRNSGSSKIVFYDIADVVEPVALEHLTITRARPGETAGAVGLIMLGDRWLVLVANWDAVRLDFYLSDTTDLRNPTNRFSARPLWMWSQATHGLGSGSVDQRWGSYQNINLFSQPGTVSRLDDLWFVATYERWADLYHLTLGAGGPVVAKAGRKQFHGGLSFHHAAGLYYDAAANALEVYAAEAHLSAVGSCRVDRWG